jgi:chromosome segregation ATPase
MDPTPPSSPAPADRDALRVQAAAVVAQQAALTEAEIRLQQRRSELDQQERQLAAHLADRRKQLLDLEEKVESARKQLLAERAEFEKGSSAAARELQQTRAERQRLQDLRKRFVRRWKSHWSSARTALHNRRRDLDAERQRLRQERETIDQARLRFNGEAELEKRRLKEMADGQRRADEAMAARERVIAERAGLLSSVGESVAAERERLTHERDALRAEAAGLEARVANARAKLQELERHAPPPRPAPEVTVSEGRSAPVEPDPDEYRSNLERLAAELADQRWHLAEQFARLREAQQSWEAEQASAAAELEALAGDLHAQDQDLAGKREALRRGEERLRQARHRAEADHARIAVQQSEWRQEHARLKAAAETQLQLAERNGKAVEELHRDWRKRFDQGLKRLADEHEALAKIGQEWRERSAELAERLLALDGERRKASEEALAVEELRQELLGKAEKPAAAQKRLDKLRQRWEGLSAPVFEELDECRRSLASEADRLDGRFRLAQEALGRALERARDQDARAAEWEGRHLKLTDGLAKREQAVAQQEAQREYDRRQAAELREEVERMARLLIGDDGDSEDRAAA